MPARAAKLLVGLGNLLKRDEGVGVVVAQRLSRRRLPPDVQVHEAGTSALDLADYLEGRRLVVVVDALESGGPPGAVYRFFPDQLRPCVRSGWSLHDLHFLDALNEVRLIGDAPREVVIFAVQVADSTTGIGLSAPVRRALPRLLTLVADELGLRASVPERRAAKTSMERPDGVRVGESLSEDEPWN